MNYSLSEIKEKATPILKNAGITRSALFGSYVRGEQNEQSDIDILVEFPPNSNLFDAGGLLMDLQDTLGKKVDLISYDHISPYLKDSILQNQYPIL